MVPLYILQENKAVDQKYSPADLILHYVAMERVDAPQGLCTTSTNINYHSHLTEVTNEEIW